MSILQELLLPAFLSPAVSHTQALLLPETLWPAGRSGPGFYEITVCFLPWSWYTGDIVCVLWEWSFLFPSVLWISCNQTLLAEFKAGLPWRALSWYFRPPGWGAWTWGLRTSLLWENLSNIIIFQLARAAHLVGLAFWFYCICASPYPLVASLSLDVGYLLVRSSVVVFCLCVLLVFWLMIVHRLVAILIFLRSELTYNIIPPICLHDG